ncbi:MAG: lipopolysaccharide heptosyltransferase I, partial [Rhodocyclaceae bacterium]|nr:lipopolysaccharide heptosyltransferase I [Rhodocyclaceae bacterium]
VPIPALHPQVRCVIPIALRRWRKQLFSSNTWKEMSAFRVRLQENRYDRIIDTQGLLKSVLVGRLARGFTVGGDAASIKEPWAARYYDQRVPVAKSRHVIDRCRTMAAVACGYTVQSPPVFGIRAEPLVADWLLHKEYAVLMHAASRPEKLWNESHWVTLGHALAQQGIVAVLPWGSPEEYQRSQRLAQIIPEAVIPPRMNLAVVAQFLAGSRIVVGLDTGFTHFAAALSVPTVGIFCDSDSVQAAVMGEAPCVSLGFKGTPPDYATVWAAVQRLL